VTNHRRVTKGIYEKLTGKKLFSCAENRIQTLHRTKNQKERRPKRQHTSFIKNSCQIEFFEERGLCKEVPIPSLLGLLEGQIMNQK
jgi:hypothetical protein